MLFRSVMSRVQDDYVQELERKDPGKFQSAVVDGIRHFFGMDSRSNKSSAKTNKSNGNLQNLKKRRNSSKNDNNIGTLQTGKK